MQNKTSETQAGYAPPAGNLISRSDWMVFIVPGT
jgi:hypothetical protein